MTRVALSLSLRSLNFIYTIEVHATQKLDVILVIFKIKNMTNKMRTCIEYVWIGKGIDIRSKTKVLDIRETSLQSVENIPIWNYDGSSTGQAEGIDSEVYIVPRRIFSDPFRGHHHKIVLCDTYTPDMIPLESNHRANAVDMFSQNPETKPWYGLEQEFFLMERDTPNQGTMSGDYKIMGFNPENKQGQYYCSIGSQNAFGRKILETHLSCCLNAGVKIAGINAEVAPGQWEFQIGPCEGIEAGDHLYIARYILERVAEDFGVCVNYDPKPISEGEWNGSGCHTNFSTHDMRVDGGYEFIEKAVAALAIRHDEHMSVYGSGNERRMTGEHETSSYSEFSFGVADRGRSIRIGTKTRDDKKGYFEDRRPSSNCDPYLVTAKMYETIVVRGDNQV